MRPPCAALLAVGLAGAAGAQPFPTRGGESGLLDVPDAEVLGLGGGLLGAELRWDRGEGGPDAVGPSPLAAALGLGVAELGLAFREGGAPGDPRPSALLFSSALKVRLAEARPRRPAIALDAVLDRANRDPVGLFRVVLSTLPGRPLRATAFVGGEIDDARPLEGGLTGGLAHSVAHRTLEIVAQALAGPRGAVVGGAVRWTPRPTFGLSLGADWLPTESGVRVGLGMGFLSPAPPRPARKAPPPARPPAPAPRAAPTGPSFADERPRFRLRVREAQVPGEGEGRRHHGGADDAPPVGLPVSPAPPAPPEGGGKP